ncbi:hypothetical protein [Desulfurococcus amylolyticus]|uniref:hypothetical protein n=1 Tax=Desulfurococcus amylolyticus TaxID=94694 RepID=UPI000662704C|nr:hypothetical protein [Desulfurococcus amylolyticus]
MPASSLVTPLRLASFFTAGEHLYPPREYQGKLKKLYGRKAKIIVIEENEQRHQENKKHPKHPKISTRI